jgi:Fur family ferric uptake transcriptional regulator
MDLVDRLRTEGYRLTPQRRLVWDVLRRAEEHLTAEQIHAEVTELVPDFNLASVYRSLGLLAELGLAKEVQLGEGMGRWEVNHPDDAFHLVCRTCGNVEHHPGDLVDQVRRHLSGDHGFTPETVDLVVHGRCASCAATLRNLAPARAAE